MDKSRIRSHISKKSFTIPLGIFLLALAVRSALSLVVIVNHGTHWFPSYSYVTTYGDYSEYVAWLNDIQLGINPYSQAGYSYPPLFVAILYPFHLIDSAYGPMIPIVLADAGAAAMVYLTALRFSSANLALAAGVIYALSPMALIYEGILWLSSEPVTFLLLLTVYLTVTRHPCLSAVGLAATVLCNQEALFVVPGFAFLILTKYRKIAAKSLVLLFGLIAAASIPFLLTVPAEYLSHITFGFLAIGRAAQSAIPPIVSSSTLSPVSSERVSSHMVLIEPTYFLQTIAIYLKFAFCLLGAPVLFAARRANVFPYLCMAYVVLVGLTVFSTVVFVDRYYFIPFYALMLAISSTSKQMSVVTVASLVSLVTPEGDFQLVLGLVALIVAAGFSASLVTSKADYRDMGPDAASIRMSAKSLRVWALVSPRVERTDF